MKKLNIHTIEIANIIFIYTTTSNLPSSGSEVTYLPSSQIRHLSYGTIIRNIHTFIIFG
jgi:hypothetical protein